MRLLPYKRCTDRMLMKNYYKENKSITPGMDFEFAYQGLKESPYYESMWKDEKRIKYYQSKKLQKQEEEAQQTH